MFSFWPWKWLQTQHILHCSLYLGGFCCTYWSCSYLGVSSPDIPFCHAWESRETRCTTHETMIMGFRIMCHMLSTAVTHDFKPVLSNRKLGTKRKTTFNNNMTRSWQGLLCRPAVDVPGISDSTTCCWCHMSLSQLQGCRHGWFAWMHGWSETLWTCTRLVCICQLSLSVCSCRAGKVTEPFTVNQSSLKEENLRLPNFFEEKKRSE